MDAKRRLQLVHDQLDMLERVGGPFGTVSAGDVIRVIRDVAGPRIEEATCVQPDCGKTITRAVGRSDWEHEGGYGLCFDLDHEGRYAWPGHDD
ncbi:hypothetical protein E3_1970 [Rhodococcus phage E3]|uniref:hypothetical protein n=1 Tax=Rhodococcus phage E3 TaxID=1007869 RepID=UPI0002C6AD3F|nr:hypothetical protein M176_gp209 [Rhodococcus phage E3]AEQ21117.1 hypothetical protein E3_1970 [Rhodococcus phage E3]